jgi:peptidylprolyl isomerase
MTQAKKGDRVKIDYTGKLADGTVFDSTLESSTSDDECAADECHEDECGCGCESGPMELTIGAGEFLPQIEEALIGMTVGGRKSLVIAAADAFGEYDETKVFTVPRSDLPDDLEPAIGDNLVLSNEDDESISVTVIELDESSITFDANHPLAGEDLSFEVHLLEIL